MQNSATNLKASLSSWWFTLSLLLAIVVLNLLPETTHQQLNLKHSPINAGEWWRLFSCHLLHLSVNHTLLNFVGYLFVTFSFRDEVSPAREILILLISAIGVGAGIYYLNPEMYSYVGLSGAIYGVLVAFILIGLNRTPTLSLAFLTFIIGKFIFEYINGGSAAQTEEFIGGKVATDSHLYGALSGILPGVLFFLKDRKRLQHQDTQRFVDQFNEPIVRDLAWVLHSPSLLKIKNSDCHTIDRQQCLALANDFTEKLKELDKDPLPLVQFVEPEKLRLGVYFEKLIKFWLSKQTRFSLIAHSLKIEDEKRTLGEFDFIVKDNSTNKTLHWEVAIKFYLGTKSFDQGKLWFGPGIKDRLDLKVNHLLGKQIRLSEQPKAIQLLQQQGITIDDRMLFVKGRLFYPSYARRATYLSPNILSQDHLKSRWYSRREILDLKSCSQLGIPFWQRPLFHICAKNEWLTLHSINETPSYNFNELKAMIKQELGDRPVVIAIIIRDHEQSRFFLVPDDWQRNTETN
ncbi:MAG: rhombosortase [Pseudomonadales bacterium]|nr:rhombosortase [Pseudomonadales bacterium]